MDVLTENHDSGICFHAPSQSLGNHVNEPPLCKLAGESGLLFGAYVLQFSQIAADTNVTKIGTRPQLWTEAPFPSGWIEVGKFGYRVLHGLLHPPAQRLDLGGVNEPAVLHSGRHHIERIPRFPLLLFLFRSIPEGATRQRSALVEEAITISFHDGWPVACPHMSQRLLHRQVDRQWVHAVDLPTADAERQAPSRQTRFGSGLFDRRRYCIAIVLNKETKRQFPDRREVHGFQHGTDVDRAVAEIGDCHSIAAGMLVCPGRAGRKRHTAAHNGIGA